MKQKSQAEFTDMPENLRNFAARLKSEMTRKNLTLRQLGEQLHKSTSTVGAWTQGKNWPEVETLIELTDILDVSFEFLVFGMEPTPFTQDDAQEAFLAHEAPNKEEPASGIPSTAPAAGLPVSPHSRPSTRLECEDYVRQLFEAAQSSADPNAFPSIMYRLKRAFPLEEFEHENPSVRAAVNAGRRGGIREAARRLAARQIAPAEEGKTG